MTKPDDWYLECALHETVGRNVAQTDLANSVLRRPNEDREAALRRVEGALGGATQHLGAVRLVAALLLGVGVVAAVMLTRPESTAARQAQDPIPSEETAAVRGPLTLEDYQDFAQRIPSLVSVETTALLDDTGAALPPNTVTTGAKSRGFDEALANTAPGDGAAIDLPLAARVALVFAKGTVQATFLSRDGQDAALVIPTASGPITLRGAVADRVGELADGASRTTPCNFKTIEVTTATEFVAALGSNRTIAIPAGAVIKITQAEFEPTERVHYATDGGGVDTWKEMRQFVYSNLEPGSDDKGSLVIQGLENLRIIAVGGRADFESDFFRSRMLEFRNCTGIAMDNFAVGHASDGKMLQTCAGGVLAFHTCRDINLHRMDLYGCGTEGILAYKTDALHADALRIHHCSYGYIFAESSRNWTVRNGMFEETFTWMDNGSIGLVAVDNFDFENCTIRALEGPTDTPVMQAIDSTGVRFAGTIEDVVGLTGTTEGFEMRDG